MRATDREVVASGVQVAGSEKAAARRLDPSHSTVKHHLASARSKGRGRRRRSSCGSSRSGCLNLHAGTSQVAAKRAECTCPRANATPASGISTGDTVGATSMPVEPAGVARREWKRGKRWIGSWHASRRTAPRPSRSHGSVTGHDGMSELGTCPAGAAARSTYDASDRSGQRPRLATSGTRRQPPGEAASTRRAGWHGTSADPRSTSRER